MTRILFVCTGNTCRSPMAEVIAVHSFAKRGLEVSVCSRGINVIVPERASAEAISAVKAEYGLDLSGHVAKQLSKSDVEKADVVIAMTHNHKHYVINAYPDYESKIYSLGELSGNPGKDVHDPYGGDSFLYMKCAEEIKECIDKISTDKMDDWL